MNTTDIKNIKKQKINRNKNREDDSWYCLKG